MATTVSIFSGGVVFAVLMFADRHHSRRTLILALVTFWVATTVLFALSRTVLGPAIELAGCHLSDRLRAAYLVGVFGDAMLRHVQQLASVLARLIPQVRRPSHSAIASWGLGVLMFNLFWFSSFLSFPLVGEDGAANYSFLVETVQNASPWQLIFPIKWLEGLGQPNVFVTVTFDPFSWLMFSGLDAPDAFRISYALRASVCWVFTYLFVSELFRRARGIALTAAGLNMLVCFILASSHAVPTSSSIPLATHAAVFPGLLWLYLKLARQSRPVGWGDLVFGPALALFLLMYPIGSLLGLPTLFAFGLALVVASRSRSRRSAGRALAKLCILSALILLTARVGLEHAWSSVAAVSARNIFASELTTYHRGYLAPHLWHDVPLGVQLVVMAAISVVLLGSRWSGSLRVVATTLILVVGVAQVATVARAVGIAPGLLDRLPRPLYMEYYLPLFYAVAAAYTVARASRIVGPGLGSIRWWSVRVAAFGGGLWAIVGSAAAVLAVAACGLVESPRAILGTRRLPDPVVRFLPGAAAMLLFAGVGVTWLVPPDTVYPLLFRPFACGHRVFWCRDPAGRTMGAGDNPIVDFLRTRLAERGEFRGRADFLLVPGLRFGRFPIAPGTALTPAEFNLVRGWYARAYAKRSPVMDRLGVFRLEPHDFRHDSSRALLLTMEKLVEQHDPAFGVLPDDVIVDIVQWVNQHPDRTPPIRFASASTLDEEVAIMVQERNRNFLATGNGFLLRALPLQGIPVASSYEQALDHLYYLLWTRYLNEGSLARRSINFTSLETVWPERLALAGVRFVVARDIPYIPPPPLMRVFGWNGYSVYEIANANTRGYSPTRVSFARSLEEELRTMRTPGFDPRHTVVVAESEGAGLDRDGALVPLRSSRVRLSGQSLIFSGLSEPGRTIAVLPFRFSHCWQPSWEGTPGRVVRADAALLGVVFDNAVRVRLSWTAGYGPRARCLSEDAALVPAARAAGRGLR